MGLADQFKEKAEQLQHKAKGKKDDSSKGSAQQGDRTQEMKDKAQGKAKEKAKDWTDENH
ncbi:hypothetical protein [Streptomyces axinellae]|uniref:CsbD family protein n=1 Tax=Streptomyces axinellae TaxID=552788 RepID=A0ABN3Q9R5_9ACTN